MTENKECAPSPSRQGFYWAELFDRQIVLAEYREHDKTQGKVWWCFESSDPTIQKERVRLTKVVFAYSKASEAEVAKALARKATPDERLQAAYNAYAGSRDGTKAWSMPIPESRQLSIGQSVEVGHLHEVKVAGFYEDRQVVVVQYQPTPSKSSSAADNGPTFLAKNWVDVLPIAPRTPGLTADRKFTQAEMSTHLGHLVSRLYKDGASDSPDYQRGYAWTQKDKELYLDSVFRGRNVGRFIFVVDMYSGSTDVLDGKQRLNALLELMTSHLSYQGVFWHQMTRDDRYKVTGRLAQFVDLQKNEYSRADLLQIFLEVNAAGVPQSEEHLDYVRELLAKEQAKTL